MRIALDADHRGFEVCRQLGDLLTGLGHEVILTGDCLNGKPCDYPDRAFAAASQVAAGEADRAVLICGSGIGMNMAANKVAGVRAALVHDEFNAECSRRHNNANVLCLAADLLTPVVAGRIVQRWLETAFDGGRHERRIRKITPIEQGQAPYDTLHDQAPTTADLN